MCRPPACTTAKWAKFDLTSRLLSPGANGSDKENLLRSIEKFFGRSPVRSSQPIDIDQMCEIPNAVGFVAQLGFVPLAEEVTVFRLERAAGAITPGDVPPISS